MFCEYFQQKKDTRTTSLVLPSTFHHSLDPPPPFASSFARLPPPLSSPLSSPSSSITTHCRLSCSASARRWPPPTPPRLDRLPDQLYSVFFFANCQEDTCHTHTHTHARTTLFTHTHARTRARTTLFTHTHTRMYIGDLTLEHFCSNCLASPRNHSASLSPLPQEAKAHTHTHAILHFRPPSRPPSRPHFCLGAAMKSRRPPPPPFARRKLYFLLSSLLGFCNVPVRLFSLLGSSFAADTFISHPKAAIAPIPHKKAV